MYTKCLNQIWNRFLYTDPKEGESQGVEFFLIPLYYHSIVDSMWIVFVLR